MPTQTFFNLPAEKREAFTRLALAAFAESDYQSASITQLVARAGIAKGSVYQYFADKQDLFLYLLDLAQRTLLEELGRTAPPDPAAGFFATLRWQMSGSVRAAAAHPLHSALLRRAHSAPLPFRDEVVERGRAAGRAHIGALVEAGIARGELSPDLDPELAAVMIGGLTTEIGAYLIDRLALDPEQAVGGDVAIFDRPEVEALFDQVIAILRRGMGAQ